MISKELGEEILFHDFHFKLYKSIMADLNSKIKKLGFYVSLCAFRISKPG